MLHVYRRGGGKQINGIGDEEAEKQSVWRIKQHADVRNQENKLQTCCGC